MFETLVPLVYYRFLTKIKHKCEEYGLGIYLINESYTSQQCPKCGHCAKENRRTQESFICVQCQYQNNADIVGALNILQRFRGGEPSSVGT